MKSSSNKLYKLSLVAIIIVSLLVVSFVQPAMTRQRDELGLTQIAALENAPPVLAFTTVALGGFRGLIANALWIRASDMQDDGRYFEQMQLADWITKLQPRMTQVWTVLAWNMAYNVSVKLPVPERWRWVKAGIELLRDEGLKYNPDDALIYRELSWFFQHKMGNNLDDAHEIYKNEWAFEMMTVLGREGTPDWDALINPETDEEVARADRLRSHFKMDPALMRELDETYGPLEWRLPEASAIYWAADGLRNSDGEYSDMLRRAIYQSMAVSFSRGRMILLGEPGAEVIVTSPNLDIAEKAQHAFLQMIELENVPIEMSSGYRNFLRDVVQNMWMYGRIAEAGRWWNTLKEVYPDAVRPGIDLDTFVIELMDEDAAGTNPRKSLALVEGQFSAAFLALATGEEESAAGHLRAASVLWNRHQEAVGCFLDPPDPNCERVGLPPIEVLKDNVLQVMLDRSSQFALRDYYRARLLTALGLPEDYDPRADDEPLQDDLSEEDASTESSDAF